MNAGHDVHRGRLRRRACRRRRAACRRSPTIRQHATTATSASPARTAQRRGVVLGKLLAGRLNAFAGRHDHAHLRSARAKINAVTGQPVPLDDAVRGHGVFDTGMYEYDNAYVYVALDVAQELAGLGDGVTGIEVKTRDRWEAPDVGEQLAKTLGFPYRTVDWQEQNKSLFQALKLEKLGMA